MLDTIPTMRNWKFGNKPIIGLTGGIGSGKSFVARLLTQLGCAVVDADALSREAMADPTILEKVRTQWGKGVFDELGQLDRKALAGLVFADPEQLKQLENIIHPYVHRQRQMMRKRFITDESVVAIVEDCPPFF